jgi:hypothetical protein
MKKAVPCTVKTGEGAAFFVIPKDHTKRGIPNVRVAG